MIATLLLMACRPSEPPAPGDVSIDGVPYASIDEALDAAAPGATIDLAEGTFFKPRWIEKPVTLRGAGPDRTVIDGRCCGGGSTLIVTAEAGHARIEGLTITGGAGSVWFHPYEDSAFYAGGGLSIFARVTLADVHVRGNQAEEGGGIFVSSDGSGLASGMLVAEDGVIIEDNDADYGLAIYAFGGSVELTSTNVVDNDGGTAAIAALGSHVTLGPGTVVERNGGDCGALSLYESSVVVDGAVIADHYGTRADGACLFSGEGSDSTLASVASDWDDDGDDVHVDGVGDWSYGAEASFVCDTDVGCR